MKILISPAKKMRVQRDSIAPRHLPQYLSETEELLSWLRACSYPELKALWGCNDKLTAENVARLAEMTLWDADTPALLAYEGIQYQYMAPEVLEDAALAYLEERLCILSGFYGVLRPMDAVLPYRLEMQAKVAVAGHKNLYAFWGDKLYRAVRDESGVIINLASKEYSKAIEAYLQPEDRFITCVFGELIGGKVLQKGVYAKMARGEMVRYLAESGAESSEEVKGFSQSGYTYREELSTETSFVFAREPGTYEEV